MKPDGGIIKIMTPQGQFLQRFWLTKGIDRGDQWPETKWDFQATDDHGNKVDIQIELVFLEGEPSNNSIQPTQKRAADFNR